MKTTFQLNETTTLELINLEFYEERFAYGIRGINQLVFKMKLGDRVEALNFSNNSPETVLDYVSIELQEFTNNNEKNVFEKGTNKEIVEMIELYARENARYGLEGIL